MDSLENTPAQKKSLIELLFLRFVKYEITPPVINAKVISLGIKIPPNVIAGLILNFLSINAKINPAATINLSNLNV